MGGDSKKFLRPTSFGKQPKRLLSPKAHFRFPKNRTISSKRFFLFKEMVRFFGNRKWALGDKSRFGCLPKLVGLKNFFESPPISGTGFFTKTTKIQLTPF